MELGNQKRIRAGERTRVACWLRCSAATIFSCATSWHPGDSWEKFAVARTRSPARETRALPDFCGYAIFLRKRNAQRMKSRFDIRMRIRRFDQYSRKFAPRRIIARISAMKYVVGNRAPNA